MFKVEFQSTLPHGSDKQNTLQQTLEGLFQSTLPHGSDMPFLFPRLQYQ